MSAGFLCADCRWFRRFLEPGDPHRGTCHCASPSAKGAFPTVWEDDFCPKFKAINTICPECIERANREGEAARHMARIQGKTEVTA